MQSTPSYAMRQCSNAVHFMGLEYKTLLFRVATRRFLLTTTIYLFVPAVRLYAANTQA